VRAKQASSVETCAAVEAQTQPASRAQSGRSLTTRRRPTVVGQCFATSDDVSPASCPARIIVAPRLVRDAGQRATQASRVARKRDGAADARAEAPPTARARP